MSNLQVSCNGFSVVEDVEVVITKSGVTKQVKVYQRDGQIYAATMGGYVSLTRKGVTSVPNLIWKDFIAMENSGFEYHIGNIGWLQIGKESNND